jgi:uncharacterized OB-fold protein
MPVVTTAPAPYLRPLPNITTRNQPYWDALREHRFVVPKCHDCGDYSWAPYPFCRSCQSANWSWTQVSGRATVYTFSVIYRAPGAFGEDVPFVLTFGQLEEQPRPCNVLSILTGVAPEDVTIGMPIEIGYVDIPSEGMTQTMWVPRQS